MTDQIDPFVAYIPVRGDFTLPHYGDELFSFADLVRRNLPGEKYDQARGTYTRKNNGVINFMDKDGVIFAGRHTEEAVKALQAAGYVEGSWGVFMSNSERPVDPILGPLWDRIRGVTEEELVTLIEASRNLPPRFEI
jgi:hypothetical protein